MQAARETRNYLARFAPRSPRIRGAVSIALIFFSGSLVVYTLSSFLRGDDFLSDLRQIGIPMMVGDGLIAFQLAFLLIWAARFHPVPKWAAMIAGVVLVATLQSGWDTQLRLWADAIPAGEGAVHLSFVRAWTLNVYHSGLFVALLAFQASNLDLKEQERLLLAARSSERDAHMLALRYQLNPHFLFNTLNAISSLVIVGRTHDAEEMIDRLSNFLRASLNADPQSLVSVEEEFEMLESYLQIEGVRFGERLVTAMELPRPLDRACIPPFLLQPIVENAIKYAVAPARRPVQVRIAAAQADGQLLLSVADDGDGSGEVAPGTGVGLANVRERLRLRYGRGARIARQQGKGGCRVEIRLPLDLVSERPVRAGERSIAA
jgi:signal transduction histidine kinase